MNFLKLTLAAFVCCWVGGSLLTSSVQAAFAQQPANQEKARTPDEIVATVEEQNIMLSQVQRHAERTIGERKLSVAQLKTVQELSLAYLVDREIVSHKLKLDSAVGENQIRIEVDILSAKLDTVGQTLDEYLASDNRTRDDLEDAIRWKLGWNGYLELQLTEEKLQKYFDTKRRQLDGTQIKVAQILFPTDETPDSVETAVALAVQVRKALIAGEVTWQTAVEKHSVAPSKENAGSIGWIGFLEPMPEKFTKAAFALEVGQVGAPFASEYGVHLIKCLEVKPGTQDLGDVRDEVKTNLEKHLFQHLAKQHREALSLSYADGWQPAQQQESN